MHALVPRYRQQLANIKAAHGEKELGKTTVGAVSARARVLACLRACVRVCTHVRVAHSPRLLRLLAACEVSRLC
jgi:hypothetical protein